MGKVKYFRNLPDQKYLYKGFAAVGAKEGTTCDECGAYIQNIVTVVGSVDHQTYNLGLTCCEKSSKGLKNIDFDDKVAIRVKYWKGRLSKLARFRKAFDKSNNPENSKVVAIQGTFAYNPRQKCTVLDFGFLYEGGDWYWMHEDYVITGLFNKVKETFADVWDQIDWMGMDACAKMETSQEIYKALTTGTVKGADWNKWCEEKYPEWDRQNVVKRAIETAVRESYYHFGPGVNLKLPKWFDATKYEDIFDDILKSITWIQQPEISQTTFVNDYDSRYDD